MLSSAERALMALLYFPEQYIQMQPELSVDWSTG